jgi:carbamoyl-phosphate synthase large subunit
MAVKEAVFPFARFPGVDTLLGPEMRSTGEVMGLDDGFDRAFLKSQIAASATPPTEGTAFISVRDEDKATILDAARRLSASGFSLIATGGTADYLSGQGITVERVNKVYEGRPHIVDRIKDGEVQLVVNTTDGAQAIQDSFEIRATALKMKIAYYTTAAGALAAARAVQSLRDGSLEVKPLQAYF